MDTAVAVKTWRAAEGAQFTDADAAIYGPRLEVLAEEQGELGLSPEAILEDARKKSSPLHPAFTWDDATAADAFRRVEARNLLNHLRVVIETPEGPQETKAFFSIVQAVEDDDPERGYMTVEAVMENADYRQQIVERAFREADAWAARYRQYSELRAIVRAIDRTKPKES